MKLSPNKKLLVKKLFALIDDDGDMDTTPYTLLLQEYVKNHGVKIKIEKITDMDGFTHSIKLKSKADEAYFQLIMAKHITPYNFFEE